MMKRVLVISVAVVFAFQAGFALAAATGNPDTGPGCGLGKLAWQNYPHQKTIGVQVMEATTNGTFGSGTFGISSGTSGCTNDGQVWASEKANVFAAINFDNLAQDMAQGQRRTPHFSRNPHGHSGRSATGVLCDDAGAVCVLREGG